MGFASRFRGIVAVDILLAIVSTATAKYSGGSGTANDPYQIATAADLIALGEDPNDYGKHFILTADIDLDPNLPGGKVFDKAVIAPDTNDTAQWFRGTPFTGVFDGNGHTISHLTTKGGRYLGLFGLLDFPAEVKNLGVVDVNITGSGDRVGGMAGCNSGHMTKCYSTGRVTGARTVGGLVGLNWGAIINCSSSATICGNEDVGGLVGHNAAAPIGSFTGVLTNCSSSGAVRGHSIVGGLSGGNWYGTVTGCYAAGDVVGTNESVGGLVGCNFDGVISHCNAIGKVSGNDGVGLLVGDNLGGRIANSYAQGVVEASKFVGGLAGWSDGPIAYCFSTGSVLGNGNVGGLVGYAEYSITNCYSTNRVSGDWNVGGLLGYNWADVTYCYSAGSVSGNKYVGGLVGSRYYSSSATCCFWDIETSGQATSAGGTEKTTAEMQMAKTFLEAGWDFVNVWGIGENQTYPYLRKYSAADINQDASVNFLDLAALAENWLTAVAP